MASKYQIPMPCRGAGSIKYKIPRNGFTVLELMVVLSIFVVITGILIANYAGLRAGRNLKIAQNELVSNLRKVQSYTLSSRAVNSNQPVQYYVLRFDTATPDRYFLDAIYDVLTSPKLLSNVETFVLPQSVKLASSTIFTIDRPPIQYPSNPTDSSDVTAANNNSNTCVLVAFKLPFASIIFNGGKDNINLSNTGCRFNNFSNDDYAKIKDFVTNSSTNTAVNNSILTITLTTDDKKLSRTVTINGLTGAIVFSE